MNQINNNETFVPNDFISNQVIQNIQNPEPVKGEDFDARKYVKAKDPKLKDINVFSDFAEKVQSQPKQKVEYQEVNMINTQTSDDVLFSQLANYRGLSDTDLRNLICGNFKYILERVMDPDPNNKYRSIVHVFVDQRVIQIMIEIAYAQPLSDIEKVYCNKLVTDYIKFASVEKGDTKPTISALTTLASVVNRDIIQQMVGFGAFDDKTANRLARASRSSLDNQVCVRNLNDVIMTLPLNILYERLITAIYYTVCGSRIKAIDLLEGIMYDVKDVSKMTESKREIYGLITLALFSMLNEMDDAGLSTTLLNYSQNKQLLYIDRPVRFNLRSFAPSDFPRLDMIIRNLDVMNKSPLLL